MQLTVEEFTELSEVLDTTYENGLSDGKETHKNRIEPNTMPTERQERINYLRSVALDSNGFVKEGCKKELAELKKEEAEQAMIEMDAEIDREEQCRKPEPVDKIVDEAFKMGAQSIKDEYAEQSTETNAYQCGYRDGKREGKDQPFIPGYEYIGEPEWIMQADIKLTKLELHYIIIELNDTTNSANAMYFGSDPAWRLHNSEGSNYYLFKANKS